MMFLIGIATGIVLALVGLVIINVHIDNKEYDRWSTTLKRKRNKH